MILIIFDILHVVYHYGKRRWGLSSNDSGNWGSECIGVAGKPMWPILKAGLGELANLVSCRDHMFGTSWLIGLNWLPLLAKGCLQGPRADSEVGRRISYDVSNS